MPTTHKAPSDPNIYVYIYIYIYTANIGILTRECLSSVFGIQVHVMMCASEESNRIFMRISYHLKQRVSDPWLHVTFLLVLAEF
jgi:hypothetical protein